ncbi:MAG: RNA polymerase sigma factor [Chloroflexota bacterium]
MSDSAPINVIASTSAAEDAELVARCRDGDEAAWAALVEKYGRLVYSIPRKIGLSEADSEDVFQTVFSALLRHVREIEQPGSLSYWLMTTSRRASWKVLRGENRTSELTEREVDERQSVDDDVAQWEREQVVKQALGRIDARCRDLLTALFLDPTEASYDRISAELGMPIGSIGPTRARCFKKVHAVLAEMGVTSSL